MVDRRTERYIYLDSGKLKESKRKYYFVNIRKKNNFFELRYKQIGKDTYNGKLKKSKKKKLIVNNRQNYLLGRVEISLNKMKVGKFVILNGSKKDILSMSKKIKLKNLVNKPFSEL